MPNAIESDQQQNPRSVVSTLSVITAPSRTDAGVESGSEEWRRAEALAARFLAGYDQPTASAYLRDLAEYARWCAVSGLAPLAADRADLDLYTRHLRAARGLSPATVGRRLSTLAGYFRRAVEDGEVERTPMQHIRRPRPGRRSASTGLSASELRALLTGAAADSDRSHALVLLLAFTGIRISEALGANIEDLGSDRDVPVLRVRRKGGWQDQVPLPANVAHALGLHHGARLAGPLFVTRTGARWDRVAAWRTLRRIARTAIPAKGATFHPHDLRHSFVTLALDAGVPLHQVQDAAGHADPRTTRHYDRARTRYDGHPAFVLAALHGAPRAAEKQSPC
ncbi:MAG: integrase/recombinase XerD [Chloroflexota bacterium]|jgi:site-specific recombinase XerD|nr:integrase/recombinase XerD [Chloroflexota bacterium]